MIRRSELNQHRLALPSYALGNPKQATKTQSQRLSFCWKAAHNDTLSTVSLCFGCAKANSWALQAQDIRVYVHITH